VLQFPEVSRQYQSELRLCVEEVARRISVVLGGSQVGVTCVSARTPESREADVSVPSGVLESAMISGVAMTCAAPAFLFLDHITRLIAEDPAKRRRAYVLEFGGFVRLEVGDTGPTHSNTRFFSWTTVRQYAELPSGVTMIRAVAESPKAAGNGEITNWTLSSAAPDRADEGPSSRVLSPNFREKLIEKALIAASNGAKFVVFEGLEVPIDVSGNITPGTGMLHGRRDGVVCYIGIPERDDEEETAS